ncbi:MAG: glycosyltransferase [Candidatus Eisenbacteria bacterium]|nr:glycosyltransferase [Candidatus Eisenbacteria bacterium]
MPEPQVVAVVVNWNGKEHLRECLSSLDEQDYEGLRIIVVDNASSDGSPDLVRRDFPGVSLVENASNEGYASGANRGLHEAREMGADYVLLLNNDLRLASDAVRALVAAFPENPRAAFVGPKIYYADRPDVIWSFGGRISWWTGNIYHVGLRERDEGQYSRPVSCDYVTGCAVMIALDALDEIGPMDTGYFMYNEDTDWCVRASRLGYDVVVTPRARIWHKVSMSSGGGLTPFKIYHRFRSTLRFFGLYARPYHWIGIVPATMARTAAFALRELLAGRTRNVGALSRGALDSIRGSGRETT